jgi:hypothetical protein
MELIPSGPGKRLMLLEHPADAPLDVGIQWLPARSLQVSEDPAAMEGVVQTGLVGGPAPRSTVLWSRQSGVILLGKADAIWTSWQGVQAWMKEGCRSLRRMPPRGPQAPPRMPPPSWAQLYFPAKGDGPCMVIMGMSSHGLLDPDKLEQFAKEDAAPVICGTPRSGMSVTEALESVQPDTMELRQHARAALRCIRSGPSQSPQPPFLLRPLPVDF